MIYPTEHKRKRVSEAAAYVGLSESTLAKYRVSGRGPRYIKAGKKVLYDETDLDTWLADNKHNSTSEYDNVHV